MAHVRAQIMGYGAVCEGLLSDALHHALVTEKMTGQKYRQYKFNDPWAKINRGVFDGLGQRTRQSFYWQIEVALELNIINQQLHAWLQRMRNQRNTVHMRT